MNKRIQEIAEQARAEVRADWDKNDKQPYPEAHYQFQRDNDQKFAELIIQECQIAVERYIGQCLEIGSLPEYVLKKHFGIKDERKE